MIADLVAFSARWLAGANVRWLAPPPGPGPVLYFANHTSHLDSLVLWSSLPARIRASARPVAARDYWGRNAFLRFLSERAFRALLIERSDVTRNSNPLEPMLAALDRGESLILFPEGTRRTTEEIGPFKGGLHHLARHRPGLALIPVHIDNLNRILPKGEFLPVPMLSCISFGPALRLEAGESRASFLHRAEEAVRSLRQT